MARQYVLTDAEIEALISSLELTKLREQEFANAADKQKADQMHRAFHFQVVRWAQDVAGYRGKS